MVRNYKPKPGSRQYKKYDPHLMEQAIKEVRNGNNPVSKIATKYEITRSVLYSRARNNMCNGMIGAPTAFSFEREEHIIKYINACVPWEYYLTTWDIRFLMKCYLDKRRVISKRKLTDNLPGPELVTNFLKRHEDAISHRIVQNMKNKSTVTVEVLLSYFHEMKMSIAEVLQDNIVCYKDILLADDIEKNVADESKTNGIFVMMAVSASGEMLQPYVISKEQNCYEIPRRTMSKKPYPRLSAQIFEDWFKSIILPYYEGRPGKKCLISGYFSSRISTELLEICKEHNVDFVFLPHNSNNLTHPLDTLSQLIHRKWDDLLFKSLLDEHQSKNLEKRFRKILLDLTNSETEKILEGFKKTGINPINPSEVLKQIPDYNETTIENVDEEFEKLEDMQDMNIDIDLVQVKEEVDWSDEYNGDDYDEEMEGIDNQITLFKAKDKVKKTNNGKSSIELDLKLSPVDFENDGINEDTTVDHMTKHVILKSNGTTASFSKESQSTGKIKGILSYPNDIGILFTEKSEKIPRISKNKSKPTNLDEEIVLVDSEKDETEDTSNVPETDPLMNCQNGTNLQTPLIINDSTAETTSSKGHCENGTCNTHTQLLEAILSSVARQEKLQERTLQAMEAQTRALDDIARVLGGWGSGNNNNA